MNWFTMLKTYVLLKIPHLVRKEAQRLSHRQKTVTRAYGGNRCAKCVRDRFVSFW